MNAEKLGASSHVMRGLTSIGFISLLAALLLSAYADPALHTIGIAEIAFLGALILSALGGLVALVDRGVARRWRLCIPIWACMFLYLVAWYFSAVRGLLSSGDFYGVIRAAAPYVVILGGLAPWFLSARTHARNAESFLIASLVVAGSLQCMLILFVFFTSISDPTSVAEIYFGRITMVDARVTLPLIFASAILPAMVLFSADASGWKKAAAAALVAFSFCAASLTLTRSLLVSMFVAWCFVTIFAVWKSVYTRSAFRILMYALAPILLIVLAGLTPVGKTVYQAFDARNHIESLTIVEENARLNGNDMETKAELVRVLGRDGVEQVCLNPDCQGVTLAQVISALIRSRGSSETIALLTKAMESVNGAVEAERRKDDLQEGEEVKRAAEAQAVIAYGQVVQEQYNVGKDSAGARIAGELLPAIREWQESGPISWVFGIGAGNAFISFGETKQTHVHNYPVHLLVFAGFFGLFAAALFFGALAVRLAYEAFSGERWLEALTLLGLLMSIGCYSMLFAVHKLISFNLIVFAVVYCVSSITCSALPKSKDSA